MDTPVPTAFNNEWTDGRGAAALCRQERGVGGGRIISARTWGIACHQVDGVVISRTPPDALILEGDRVEPLPGAGGSRGGDGRRTWTLLLPVPQAVGGETEAWASVAQPVGGQSGIVPNASSGIDPCYRQPSCVGLPAECCGPAARP